MSFFSLFRSVGFLPVLIVNAMLSLWAGEVAPVPSLRQQQLRLGKIKLDLTIDPEQQTISGSATLELAFEGKPKNIELDLDRALTVNEVSINGMTATFRRLGNKLFVDTSTYDPLSLTIHYGGRPRVAKNPPWQGGFNWSRDDAGNPWVGVSCQQESAMLWLPCIGGSPAAKFRGAELRFTVPDDLYCAANGRLVDVTPAGEGLKTFVWATNYPISHYNINVNLGKFKVHERLYEGTAEMPVFFYALQAQQKEDQQQDPKKGYQAKIDNLLDLTLEYLQFYANWYGEYPFIKDKFAMVHTDYYGMEHQTINAYGNHFKIEDGYDYILLHEMGHEWWGNKVTVSNWADFWIHEGVCTYTTGIFLEERYGKRHGIDYFKGLIGNVANRKPIVPPGIPDASDAYHSDLYFKSALVVYALRAVLGREAVDDILRAVATDSQHTYDKPISTADFIAHAERIAGRDLDWFFDRYLHQASLPKLNVKRDGKRLKLAWAEANFPMPIEVALTRRGKTKIKRLDMSNGKGSLRLRKGQRWVIDPDSRVLKEVVEQ